MTRGHMFDTMTKYLMRRTLTAIELLLPLPTITPTTYSLFELILTIMVGQSLQRDGDSFGILGILDTGYFRGGTESRRSLLSVGYQPRQPILSGMWTRKRWAVSSGFRQKHQNVNRKVARRDLSSPSPYESKLDVSERYSQDNGRDGGMASRTGASLDEREGTRRFETSRDRERTEEGRRGGSQHLLFKYTRRKPLFLLLRAKNSDIGSEFVTNIW